MGVMRENQIQVKTLDVLNALTLEGTPITLPGYPGAGYKGRKYFVNNIQGNANNGGKSWNNAMDEPSTAITAWEAYRTTLTANDQNVRGQIFVQGTATPYAEITALPSYCDLIAIGADPNGNGAGIARIGADTGNGGGLTGTSSARGLYMSGFQFQAGVGNYAFKMSNIFRSHIENCVIATNGSPGGSPAGGFVVAIASGLEMNNVNWLNQSSLTNSNDIGLDITGTHFHGSHIKDCHITGKTAGVRIASTTINGYNSYFKECYIGWGGSTCAIGVDDNATVGHIVYRRCDVLATNAFDLAADATGRVIGCMSADGFVT